MASTSTQIQPSSPTRRIEAPKNAARRNAAIFFEDEVGFSQQGTTIQTWAPIGEGTIIESAPGRQSVKAFGAIEYAAKPRFIYTFAYPLNGLTFVEFLQRLLDAEPDRPIYLVLDGARYHHSEEVCVFLATLPRGRLWLVKLPPYSPEFNPAEFVWRETKRLATHNRYFPELDTLRDAVHRQFDRFSESPELIHGALSLYL